jgi:integrase
MTDIAPATEQNDKDPDSIGSPIMARHTSMPARTQKTPHGDVSLTSRWTHERYYLVAYGPAQSLAWMFPNAFSGSFEQVGGMARHVFAPSPRPITVERDLRRVCSVWQAKWNERVQDEIEASPTEANTTSQQVLSTLDDLFTHLLNIRTASLRPTTVVRDRSYHIYWRRELGAATALRSLNEPVLIAARDRLAKATSPATANDAFAVLKTYLNWAFNQGLLPNAAFKTIRRLRIQRGERHRRAWWTADEVELALRCAAKDNQARNAVLYVAIGCLLGLRVEEAIMLRWQDLSLDAVDPKTGDPRPVAHVTPHDGWVPKDGEARDIPIQRRLLEILRQWRKSSGYLLEADAVRTRRKAQAPWAYRYDPKKIWARLCEAVVKAGGKRITAYGMRHSFASNLLIAGVSDVKVAHWLGHADTRMVHQHYGHMLSYDPDINAVAYPTGK